MKIIKLRRQFHRCAEFERIRARFDNDISYAVRTAERNHRPVEQGQVFRLKRSKAERLNYHLDRCPECG